MTTNVFGVPITDATLRAMPKYANKQWIARLDRAREAFNVKNAEDKYTHALQYAKQLKADYGTGVSTLCVFYNATGDTVKLVTSHDWEGHIWKSPYPTEVANGQWGAFVHVRTSGVRAGSVSAVAYCGKNDSGKDFAWVFCWSNPWNRSSGHKVYVEARQVDHYRTNEVWNWLNDLLNNGDLAWSEECDGCVSEGTITDRTPVVVGAIFTLKGADC